MTLEACIDGGSRRNPGPSGFGVYLPGLVSVAEYLGHKANNFAENSALVSALRFAADRECKQLKIYSDSELVVKQIKGIYTVRNESIRPLSEWAKDLIARLPRFSIEHVRREFNRVADKLANEAMDLKGNLMRWESTDPTSSQPGLFQP
jgi:probable phosphoglycerate mutase